MAVHLSAEITRAMGFRSLEAGASLTASFTSVSVYEARGITLETATKETTVGTIGGVNYRVGVGAGLNDTCMALTNDVFVEHEDPWKKKQQCRGPFVLIQLGPTRAYTITEGRTKTEVDGSLTTLESFPGLSEELSALEAAALPPLLTSLACLLGDPNRHVELRKLDRASVGRTDSGQVIRDFYLRFSGSAYVSLGLPAGQLATNLPAATALAPQLNAKAARFFALGMGEDDELKKFLYFFLALEVATHATFGRIDHRASLDALLAPDSPSQPATVALLTRQTEQIRGLFDRFVWCAACVWPGVGSDEIEQFKRLKAARDDIAHGSASEPPQGHARVAEQLARKVLRSQSRQRLAPLRGDDAVRDISI